MTQPHNPFTHTGFLRLHHPLFRGPEELLARLERDCLDARDYFLILYGGRRNGKTSLLLQLEERLRARRAEGVVVCRVSFRSKPRATAEVAYRYLAEQIAQCLPGAPRPTATSDASALLLFLEQTMAHADVTRFVLLLDELGPLRDETREDLAVVLSDLHERRSSSPALAKIQVLLAGGIELYRLVAIDTSTLHTVSKIERLDDLSEADAVNLIATGLGLVGVEVSTASAFGRAVYTRVGGHPYLTQRLGDLLAARHLRAEPLGESALEAATRSLLEQDEPLLNHLWHSVVELGLEDATRLLLSVSLPTMRADDAMARLEVLGLARRGGRLWAPRNALLAVALAERLGMFIPADLSLLAASAAVQTAAARQRISDLKEEHAGATARAPLARTPAEQVRLKRRANELADEIARIEAAQRVTPPAIEPTVAPVEPPPMFVPSAPSPSPTARTSSLIPHPSSLILHPSSLIHISAGPFLMGSADADTQADSNEKPQHTLTLPDFWIGKTPITNAQFRPFVEGDGYRNQVYWTEVGWQWREQDKIIKPGYWDDTRWNGADYPVVGLSWFEAVAYCRWLSAQVGHEFRLPTEAEWEKAACGTDGRIWPWGNTWESGRCNSEEASLKRTTPVGQYPTGASPCGALDMAGNVWEWCATKYGKGYPYLLEDEWAEAYLEADAGRRLRGGSSWNEQKGVRGAYRYSFSARYRYYVFGLRVASHSLMPGSDS